MTQREVVTDTTEVCNRVAIPSHSPLPLPLNKTTPLMTLTMTPCYQNYIHDLQSLVLDRLSRELCGMVSSMSITSSSPIKAMSGRADHEGSYQGTESHSVQLQLLLV